MMMYKLQDKPRPNFLSKENLQNNFSALIELLNNNSNQNFPKGNFLDSLAPEYFSAFKDFKILSKKLNNKNLIISSASTSLIRSIMDSVIYIFFFETLTYDVFLQIFNLFDYFIIATLFMFTEKKIICCLFEEINTEDLRKKGKIDYAIEMVLFQKRYSNLRKFITQTRINFENLFEKNLDLLNNDYDIECYENLEFHLPKLNSEINLLDNNIYSGMIENIVLFESIHSIYKLLKRLKVYTKNIELDIKVNEIEKKFSVYKQVISEIKMFFYKPICNNIFKVDTIMNKAMNIKWDLKDQESELQFNEASPFIDNIFQEICEKYDKLFLLSAGSLTEKSQKRFLEVILVFFAEKLMDAFSKIKKVICIY